MREAMAAEAVDAAAAASSGSLVITAVRLLDVRSGRYVDNPQLLIEQGRIVAWAARTMPCPRMRGAPSCRFVRRVGVHIDLTR